MTPSRSNRTASYRSRLMRLLSGCGMNRSPVTQAPERITAPRRELVEERSVPNSYCRYFAVVAKHAQRARIQQKMLTTASKQADPARHQHAQHVSMREQCCIAIERARPGDHPVHAGTHVLRCLAARAPVAEEEPTRGHLLDLLGRQPLVLAVVPLSR